MHAILEIRPLIVPHEYNFKIIEILRQDFSNKEKIVIFLSLSFLFHFLFV